MGIAAMIGSPIKRREDPRLITGQATYVDDIKLHGMLHMAVLRSPYGHARIKGINTEPARQHPGSALSIPQQTSKGWSDRSLSRFPSDISRKVWAFTAPWPRARCVFMVIPSLWSSLMIPIPRATPLI